MTYEAILARSFSRYEQKKLGWGALLGCFLIFLSFFTVFKPYLGPLPILNMRLSMGVAHRMFATKETESSQKQEMVRVAQKEAAKSELLLVSTSHQENVTTKPELRLNSTDPKENTTRTKPEILLNSTDHHVAKNVTLEPGPEVLLNNTEHPAVEIEESEQLNSTDHQDTSLSIAGNATQKRVPLCNILNPRTDICDITGEVRVHAKSYTVYASSTEMSTLDDGQTSWKIRPYARKTDRTAMSSVTEWSVVPASVDRRKIPKCTQNHAAPAILFSAGGFSGNHFHDFSDIILPLYLTARPFNGDVQLLVTNYRSWWASKFRAILQNLSKHPAIDIDQQKEEVHCFPSVIVGLNRHDEFKINPSMPPHTTMRDFREFLRTSYSLERAKAIELQASDTRKPRLLIVARKRSRSFTNPTRIAKTAKAVGFEPVVAEADMNVARFAELMNSCDAVMGVHGAGLTNILFLPDDAVLIQIVPLGGAWLSRTYFGDPSRDMNLRYLEYKIGVRESTLADQYPVDHVALKDPSAFHRGKWNDFKKIYLDNQNVKLDVRRFRPTLLKALQLLREQKRR
ncbi:beta-1,2-xylosyltransferase XYXT1-like isoform X2 [Rhodamnia argentea]|uniref:Beta-1,2-xylosyltransferase XYXT1-like isoform X2 n=1 Tax=Rhodamnia argentea TaxID=178133 RepID=A0A8B8NH89_9MYRT|nr:beta-1,2-xylosyltransferase XYXT1-like isoform X2 [Rhodamnia argentea]